MTTSPWRRRRRIAALALLAPTLVLAAAVGTRWLSGNRGTVVPGEVYRSAQLGDEAIARLIERRGIRTVLNLRGPNPEASWYRDERRAVLDAGATLIDVPLASDYWLTREQARSLIGTLDRAERPVLIHCQFGSERTGLTSAIVELLRPDGSLRDAEAEFSPYYLFLPIQDGAVMIGHLRQYEAWLDAEGAGHTPGRFRRWIAEGYEPGTPNRSQWPYDPYPLRVVHEPPDAPQAAPSRRR